MVSAAVSHGDAAAADARPCADGDAGAHGGTDGDGDGNAAESRPERFHRAVEAECDAVGMVCVRETVFVYKYEVRVRGDTDGDRGLGHDFCTIALHISDLIGFTHGFNTTRTLICHSRVINEGSDCVLWGSVPRFVRRRRPRGGARWGEELLLHRGPGRGNAQAAATGDIKTWTTTETSRGRQAVCESYEVLPRVLRC